MSPNREMRRRKLHEMSLEERTREAQLRQFIDRKNKMQMKMGLHRKKVIDPIVPKWARWASINLPPKWYIHFGRTVTANANPIPLLPLLFLSQAPLLWEVLTVLSFGALMWFFQTRIIPFNALVWKLPLPVVLKKSILFPLNVVDLIASIVLVRPFIEFRKIMCDWSIRTVFDHDPENQWHWTMLIYKYGKLVDRSEWEG